MKAFREAPAGRARSALIGLLLGAALLLVALLAAEAHAAWRAQRRAAESVLRSYSRMAATEFIRRASGDIGYRGFYATATALQQRLAGTPPQTLMTPADLPAVLDSLGRPLPGLIRTLFLADVESGRVIETSGVELDEAARELLAGKVPGIAAARGDRREPFVGVSATTDSGQRLFILTRLPAAAANPGRVAGFEVDLRALAPWLARTVAAGPLLPLPSEESAPSNDVLYLEVQDGSGDTLFTSGASPGGPLTTSTPFGDAYSGVFEGLTVRAAIAPQAASRLVIGGLPRSRLPLLASLLLLTAGLLAAAVWQMRRERELVRMRAEFVSRVSHELRTPLTQIRMFAETLLLGRDRSEAERRRSLAIIDQESRRLGHLVENVLLFARRDRGAVALAPRPLDLGALVRNLSESFLPVARARGMHLSVAECRTPVTCLADDGAMRQVLLNLLDNAVKFGPPGQSIRIAVDSDGRRAWVRIEDQGPGVPAADRERIWSRWQRLERDERRAIAGTGIGLTVVRDLVEQHGGSTRVEPGSGRGACFVVELPALTATPSESAPTAVAPLPREGQA